jgi:hypothetical protein
MPKKLIRYKGSVIDLENVVAVFFNEETMADAEGKPQIVKMMRVYHASQDFHFFLNLGDDYESVRKQVLDILNPLDLLATGKE